MVDENYHMHEHIQHRDVAANKPDNRHRENHSVQHKSLRLVRSAVSRTSKGNVYASPDRRREVLTNVLDQKGILTNLTGTRCERKNGRELYNTLEYPKRLSRREG